MNVKHNAAVLAILIFSALARNAAGVIQLGGTITTNGDLIYSDAVVLTNNTKLISTGGGMIAFNSTVNGPYSLEVNTAGSIVINGTVGGVNALSQLTATGGGTISILVSALTTTGSQTYDGAVVVGADAALTSTSSGGIKFNSTVNGDYSLTVNTAGATVFGGNVSLAGLTTDVGGTTQIAGPVVTTLGSQAYNDAVVLGADVAFSTTSTGNIGFSSTVDGTYALTVNAVGSVVFNDALGGVNALNSLGVSGTTQISGDIVTIGSQIYNNAVVLAADVAFSSVGAGHIAFNSTVNGAYTLDINAGGAIVFNGAVGGADPLSSLTAAATDGIQTYGGTMATTGSQIYNNAVLLGADTVFTSTDSGGIAFSSTVDGAYSLTVNAPAASVFAGGVSVSSLTTDSAGTTQIRGTITTTGSQTYNDAVVLGANATVTSTATGNIAFNSTVNGPYSLAIAAADSIVFNGAVGGVNALSNLTASAADTIWINTSMLKTTGTQTYNDAVGLAADAALTSSGSGGIAFNSTVDGAYGLTVDAAGPTVFNGAVGGVNALKNLEIKGTAQIHGDVITTGSQSYNNHVTLTPNATLTADQVDFSAGASSSGSVAIAAALINGGFIAVNGGTLNFMGGVTNSATIRAYDGAVLNFGTTVFNSGVIDALAGSAILGGSFSNSGLFVEASSFVIGEIRKVDDDIRLAWATMGGHEYVLQAATPPPGGGYTNNFSDISPILTVGGQSLGVTNYLDIGSATNLNSRYYRVRLQL